MTTPARVFLADRARERFSAAAAACARSSTPELALCGAYSVKTNPRAELLAHALQHGFAAEVISAAELVWALDCGFAPDRIVYNGPDALRERPRRGRISLALADSREAFARYAALAAAEITGVRLRPEGVPSRFGAAAGDDDELAAALRALPANEGFGVSFHVRREDLGLLTWRDVAAHVLERAQRLERRSGRRAAVFDMGGGWEPAALDAALAGDVPWLLREVRGALRDVRTVLFEPGQSLATPSEALIVTVLELRTRDGAREAIVDAGYPDLPQIRSYAHALFVERSDRWVPLGPGCDRVAGRTCLEYDILASDVALPADIIEGDRLIVGDCGSYDASMSFAFARGGAREAFAYSESA
ncbi:MAG: hypothetical protein ABR591_02080 [Candidatus Velthaea sp.]